MRRLIAFPCQGETLVGTLDDASGTTGLLIVSGGNEIRIGAHRGMALLSARIAAAGYPVFRFDRRGIGDSTGENRGFRESAPDIAAATATFAAEAPHVRKLVAFGNCDAATALALFHSAASVDSLVLANPWLVETADELPPAAAIRARYAERLRDPKQWLRLMRGGVDLSKLIKGLSKLSSARSEENGLAEQMAATLGTSPAALTLLLARGDNTAVAFRELWQRPSFASAAARARVIERDTASHSFAPSSDKDWLFEELLAVLAS